MFSQIRPRPFYPGSFLVYEDSERGMTARPDCRDRDLVFLSPFRYSRPQCQCIMQPTIRSSCISTTYFSNHFTASSKKRSRCGQTAFNQSRCADPSRAGRSKVNSSRSHVKAVPAVCVLTGRTWISGKGVANDLPLL